MSSPAPDKSPKGAVDAGVVPLLDILNSHPAYFTTSSCSGRVSILAHPGGAPATQDAEEDPTKTLAHLSLSSSSLFATMSNGGGSGDDSGGGVTASNHGDEETVTREAPQLLAVLTEMKEAMDAVRSRVEALTQKVKQNQFSTANGMNYLEAKHLLLLSYCQSIVYYVLRKAKGLSVGSHPVVASLVEIRLFLEKVRPIDKKLQFQIQKLMKAANSLVADKASIGDNEKEIARDEDHTKYRPNKDMLENKSTLAAQDTGGIYRPPKFAPTSMDEDKMSKQEKQTLRREKAMLREARQSTFMKGIMDDLEDRPEEVRETVGAESRELTRYKAKLEDRARKEEELFTRAPITKRDKKIEKQMKSRNGLLGLTDSFHDEIRMLPMEENENENHPMSSSTYKGGKRFRKRKRKH